MAESIMKIDGMLCSMCKAHIGDMLRRSISAKRMAASHAMGWCAVEAENGLDKGLPRGLF